MRKFILNLIYFSSPIIFLVFPIAILLYTNEISFSIDKIITNDKKYIFGIAYSEVGRQFKYQNIILKDRFNIIALGSSRVMQFREEMFNQSFYNAGGIAQSITDYRQFLTSIPNEKIPEIVILELDQWMFNSAYDEINCYNGYEKWKDISGIRKNIDQKISNLVSDYLKNKFELSDLFNEDKYDLYGLNAMVKGNGYRRDGSFYYCNEIYKLMSNDSTYQDYKFKNTISRIEKGCCRFEYGDEINHKAVRVLDSLLAFCKEKNIHVVGLIPPFSDKVYEKMIISGKYKYLLELDDFIRPVFSNYNYELYNFPSVMSCNSADDETIDGFHGGEVTYLRILIEMLDSGSLLNAVSDSIYLKSSFQKKENRYLVFKY